MRGADWPLAVSIVRCNVIELVSQSHAFFSTSSANQLPTRDCGIGDCSAPVCLPLEKPALVERPAPGRTVRQCHQRTLLSARVVACTEFRPPTMMLPGSVRGY